MIERDRVLQYVFLDDDLLCGLHKRHGHEALPDACQAYPFGFVKNERGEAVAQLSRHCPSIQNNYDEPLAGQVDTKLAQADNAQKLAPRMGLRSGRTLPTQQYLTITSTWRNALESGSPTTALIRAYELTDTFDTALPADSSPNEREVHTALAQASDGLEKVGGAVPRRRPN